MQPQPGKVQRGQGRVAFLALREEFRKLLQAGHPLVSIHRHHKQQLGIGYAQFTKYIHRYLKTEANNHHQNENTTFSTEENLQNAGLENPKAAQRTERKPAGFTHNPNSGNSRGDLI